MFCIKSCSFWSFRIVKTSRMQLFYLICRHNPWFVKHIPFFIKVYYKHDHTQNFFIGRFSSCSTTLKSINIIFNVFSMRFYLYVTRCFILNVCYAKNSLIHFEMCIFFKKVNVALKIIFFFYPFLKLYAIFEKITLVI